MFCPILYPQYLWMALGPLVPVINVVSTFLTVIVGIAATCAATIVLVGRFKGGRRRS